MHKTTFNASYIFIEKTQLLARSADNSNEGDVFYDGMPNNKRAQRRTPVDRSIFVGADKKACERDAFFPAARKCRDAGISSHAAVAVQREARHVFMHAGDMRPVVGAADPGDHCVLHGLV